ncbi:MAG: hypothetical protein IJG64_02480 [Oscillospiraceae bacterium]|jgi:hypothetical protein|nr:hypothetical protein [Oscillospiraceae bacterium]
MDTPLTYKGLPLVRGEDEFYYGNPTDRVIAYMKVLSTKKIGDETVADRIHVSLISTDTSLDLMQRMIPGKSGVRNGLYNALDVASVWLQSELSK